jgi:hypothetical protein
MIGSAFLILRAPASVTSVFRALTYDWRGKSVYPGIATGMDPLPWSPDNTRPGHRLLEHLCTGLCYSGVAQIEF